MTTRVNYDDNIFFIQSIIQTLDAGIRLNIDGDLFRDKFVEDILFVDSSLSRVLTQLRENRYLIRRAEYLRALMRAETLFLELLRKCLDPEVPFSEELSTVAHKLKACRSSHQRSLEEVKSTLQETSSSDFAEDVVSQEEFRSLLEDDEDSEEQA